MTPVYFRYIGTYFVSNDLLNVEFKLNEDDFFKLSEYEWASFGAYSRQHEGVNRKYLYIFVVAADYSSLVNSYFNNKSSLTESDQKELNKIVGTFITDLSNKADNLLRKFRWLTGLKFDLSLKGEFISLEWTRDKLAWEKVPYTPEPTFIIDDFLGHDPTGRIDKELIDAVIVPNLSLTEPLGHDLLLEAYRLHTNNDLRGAFTIGFSALEVGIKDFIKLQIPRASWLLTYSPSPDILKICNQYLPELDSRLSIENTTEKRLIRKYMESRNKLVHSGVFEENRETIAKKLRMVEYMLHRFDLCSGLVRAELYAEIARQKMEAIGKEDLS